MGSLQPFTERELTILGLLAERRTDREIAARLHLSPETVRWYNKQLYARLGVSSRHDAAERARALGLLASPAPSALAVSRTPVRYVANDGVSIAWQSFGAGPVDVVFLSGFVSHLEMFLENAEYAAFVERIGRHARLIVLDRRGVGLSDRMRGAPTIDDTIGDVRAVLAAAGVRSAFVVGTSESGASAVLLASMHPELVQGLILVNATALPARSGAEPAWAKSREHFRGTIEAIVGTWGTPWAIERMAPSRRGDDVFAAWWARTLRAASSPSSIQAVLEQAMRVDIRSVLPSVRTPTLVIHRRGDQVVDVEAGRFLAAGIPNAQLLVLPGEDHVWFINGLDIADAIVGFVGAPREPPEVDTWLATALFCGGPGGLLDAEKRALLDAGGARFVRVAPGGWVALFDSPTRAMRLADRLASLGRGRIGVLALHVGPCRVSDGEPAGHAFESGWRLLSKGAPGEVLVSATLRDILVGSARELVPRAVDAGDGDATASTVWLMRS